MCKDGLTQPSLFDLFGRHGKRGNQLYQYLDNYFSHSGRERDFGVNLKPVEKAQDGLEEIDKGIVTRTDIFHRLRAWKLQGPARENWRDTYRKEGSDADVYCSHKWNGL